MRSSLAGDQIDYADEMPMVWKMFADELAPRAWIRCAGARRPAAASGEVGVASLYCWFTTVARAPRP
jgi:hypothetical protein